MLVLLPPSETKRDGGVAGSRLDLSLLRFPEVTEQRAATIAALSGLSRDPSAAAAALGLGPTQGIEIERNRAVESSPVMAAIDRYTGVLYDGIAAHTLGEAERAWIAEHVLVNSALFGLVGAGDPVPAYRLSHDARLPGLPLKKHWRTALGGVLAARTGLLLDLRSEAYAALGPLPARDGAFYLRVVTETPTGQKKAMNHFNKKGKGVFVRRLAASGIDHADVASLIDWASASGIRLEHGAPGELELTV